LLSDSQASAFEILARWNGLPVAEWNWEVVRVQQKKASTRMIAMALLIFLVLIEVYFGL